MNLAKLPREKKLNLACMTVQLQNLPTLARRTLGYQAYTLRYGHASWIKGYFAARFIQDAIAGANYPVDPDHARTLSPRSPPAARIGSRTVTGAAEERRHVDFPDSPV